MKSSTAPSSAIRRRSGLAGFSLAEIVVALALVSLLLLSIYSVLNSGTRYLRETTMVTDLQQSCVVAATRLVGELLESNRNSIRADAEHQSVSFGSARNTSNEMTFNTTTDGAELEWYNIVGYYIDVAREEPGLFRKAEPLGAPQTNAPLISSSYDAAYWIGYGSQRQLVANRVYYVDVVSSTNVDVILGVKSRDGLFQVFMKTKLKCRN